jgi:N-acyl-D-amino-acid deacylase
VAWTLSGFDLLIKNGTLIDGTGKERFRADIGVTDGKIEEIGELDVEVAERVIDAEGRFVSPGFIDNHAHSDWTVLIHPTGDSKVMQGITTELSGLCGYAAAPIDRDEWWKLLYVRMTVGWSMHYAAAAYNSWPLPYGRRIDVDWSTMAEYLDRVERTGVGLNYAMLFGHGAVRYYVMGLEARAAEDDELSRMKAMAEQAMEDGAFGMSAGLSGCPGCWADTDELVELCGVVKEYDGVYMPHMRSSTLRSSVEESIEIAEKTGVRTCMSHARLTSETRRLVDEARSRGVDIAFDIYPYPGSIAGNIVYMLPHWLSRRREEGFDWVIEQLRDPKVRDKFIEKDYPEWRIRQVSVSGKPPHRPEPGQSLEPDWSGMQLQMVWTADNQKYVGMTFAEIAEERGVDPWTAWFDMEVEEKGYLRWLNFRGTSYEEMYNPALEEQLKTPYVCIESDAPIESPRGVTISSVDPRSYGTFPLVLGEYVRKRKVLSWEDAIMKMTSNPARSMGLRDRGLLRRGYWADIVVFNPETFAHRANFKNCLELSQGLNHDIYPVGIDYTIVNGVVVVEKGTLTGARPGHVLRQKHE